MDEPAETAGEQATQERKSFLRQWGGLIAFGVIVIALMFGYSAWIDYQSNQPIVEEYDAYLRYLAERSAKAREYRAAYAKDHRRESVTSADFQRVCMRMTDLARDEGVDVNGFKGPMALDCRTMRHN